MSDYKIGIYDSDPESIKVMAERYKKQCDDAEVNAIEDLFVMLTKEQQAGLVMRGQCQAYQQALKIVASAGRGERRKQ